MDNRANALGRHLKSLPTEDGMVYLSQPRRFAHDETLYDQQYANEPSHFLAGRGLVKLLKSTGADFTGPALEIGCGTGLLSLGLVAGEPYPLTLLTDPSPDFVRITRKKLRSNAAETSGLRYGILMAEEVDRLQPDTFSLIALRSTLHHVSDVEKFIQHSARALCANGVLAFQEPCMEGYVLMGAMAQFLPAVVQNEGGRLTDAQAASVKLFVDSMCFYARRDLDKSAAEDKHLFRVDELTKIGAACGLDVEFWPNLSYENFAVEGWAQPDQANFQSFFYNYLKYCMSFDEALMQIFQKHFAKYCKFVNDISANGAGPYMHGVFLCRKR